MKRLLQSPRKFFSPILRTGLALCCMMLMAVTCFDDPEPDPEPEPDPDPDPKVEYTISANPSGTITFPAEGGSVEIRVTTNAPYYGYSFPKRDWMSAKFDKEKTYNNIVITLTANMTPSERSNEVTIYGSKESGGAHEVETKVKVVQPSAVKDLSVASMEGKLDFGGTVDTKGYTVMTMMESKAVGDGNSFSASGSSSTDVPQPVLVCNTAGDVVLMSRKPYVAGAQVNVDIRTTALALVTMYPLFAPVQGAKEFQTLETMILGAKRWSNYEAEVSKTVKAGKPVLDPSNKALVSALDSLLSELCVPKSVISVTKAPTEVLGHSNEQPFKVQLSGHVVQFFNYGLTPMYEGKLYHVLDLDNPVGSVDIPSSDDYGITDIFLRESFTWGKAAEFNFDTLPSDAGEGMFIFCFSRVTTKAQLDFTVNFVMSALDIFGASVGAVGTSTLKQAIYKYLVQRGSAFIQLLMSGKWTAGELMEATYNLVLDFLSSPEFIEVAGIALSASALAVVKKLSLVTTIYSGVRGASNLVLRCHYMLDAPETVELSVCYKEAFPLNSCNFVELEVVSGDKQRGKAGEWLEEPIRIRVDTTGVQNASSAYYLRFSLEGGDGELMDEQLYTYNLEAETHWKLGRDGQVQHMWVDAIDVVTGAVISSKPLTLTAFATDQEIEKKPIPEQYRGKWIQTNIPADQKPIEIELTTYKASFYYPYYENYCFNKFDVWYFEDYVDGEHREAIYFDETDPTTGWYELFLDYISGDYISLHVGNVYWLAEDADFIPKYDLSVDPDQITFTSNGGTEIVTIENSTRPKHGADVRKEGKDWCSAVTEADFTVAITAQPNLTGKRRECYVDCYVSDVDDPTEEQKEKVAVHVIQEAESGLPDGTPVNVSVIQFSSRNLSLCKWYSWTKDDGSESGTRNSWRDHSFTLTFADNMQKTMTASLSGSTIHVKANYTKGSSDGDGYYTSISFKIEGFSGDYQHCKVTDLVCTYVAGPQTKEIHIASIPVQTYVRKTEYTVWLWFEATLAEGLQVSSLKDHEYWEGVNFVGHGTNDYTYLSDSANKAKLDFRFNPPGSN